VKKNNRSRKQKMFSKTKNILLTLLSVSTAIRIWLGPGSIESKSAATLRAYTGFGADGSFDASRLIEGYAPAGAAFGVGTLLHFIQKKFPVR